MSELSAVGIEYPDLEQYSDIPRFNMKAVVRQTGISAPTLRAWERRYDLFSPPKGDTDYGLYSERNIVLLRWLKERIDAGMSISQAIALLRHLEMGKQTIIGMLAIPFISQLRIRIVEDPLTVSNLNTIISSLTELSTKYWLIAKGRFADLIEYTQTHNSRFAEEANALVTRVSYNSPFNMDWKIDLSAPSVAEALVTTIDGVAQRRERLEKAQLENQAKVLEIKTTEQKAEHDNQMAQIAQEEQRLKLEERRLEIIEKQLDIQKKSIEYAMEMAEKMVDLLHPAADSATRAMEIQVLLPNLVQLQNGKGLELALPVPQENQTTPKQNLEP